MIYLVSYHRGCEYAQNPIAAGQGTIALLSAVGYLNRL